MKLRLKQKYSNYSGLALFVLSGVVLLSFASQVLAYTVTPVGDRIFRMPYASTSDRSDPTWPRNFDDVECTFEDHSHIVCKNMFIEMHDTEVHYWYHRGLSKAGYAIFATTENNEEGRSYPEGNNHRWGYLRLEGPSNGTFWRESDINQTHTSNLSHTFDPTKSDVLIHNASGSANHIKNEDRMLDENITCGLGNRGSDCENGFSARPNVPRGVVNKRHDSCRVIDTSRIDCDLEVLRAGDSESSKQAITYWFDPYKSAGLGGLFYKSRNDRYGYVHFEKRKNFNANFWLQAKPRTTLSVSADNIGQGMRGDDVNDQDNVAANPDASLPRVCRYDDFANSVASDGKVSADDLKQKWEDRHGGRCIPGHYTSVEDFLAAPNDDTDIDEAAKDDPGDIEAGSDGSSGSSEPEITCDAGPGLTLIICSTITFIENVVSTMASIIQELLIVNPLSTQDDSGLESDTFAVWKGMRNLANVILIPVFFVIIFSQALSLNIDAYTIKKMLPRIVVAAILIQFSFFLMAIAIDITNVVGQGISNLALEPVSDSEIVLDFTSGGAKALGVLGVLTAGGLLVTAGVTGAIFFVLVPLGLAVLGTFFTLIFRHILIIALAIVSPLAFAAWTLPNTENLFKMWSSLFIRALAMYPIIMLLFAAGTLVAAIFTG